MQHRGSSLQALATAVRFWCSCGALAAALAACGDDYCDPRTGQDCSFPNSFDSSSSDDDPPPCASLGEAECRRSGRCFVDSVCKVAACSGVSCSDSCELVRTCVDY
jgi:hypothetical protein